MTELEFVKAERLLKSEGIEGKPTNIELITMIDKKPHAYRVAYHNGKSIETAVCYEKE